MPGRARGSIALSASGVQTGHPASAGSQPASAWGRPPTRTAPSQTWQVAIGQAPYLCQTSYNENGRHGARVLAW